MGTGDDVKKNKEEKKKGVKGSPRTYSVPPLEERRLFYHELFRIPSSVLKELLSYEYAAYASDIERTDDGKLYGANAAPLSLNESKEMFKERIGTPLDEVLKMKEAIGDNEIFPNSTVSDSLIKQHRENMYASMEQSFDAHLSGKTFPVPKYYHELVDGVH